MEAGRQPDDLRHRVELQNIARDGALIVIALLSLWLTPDEHRAANGFTWEPIKEVAKLFAGIFVCIIPVLAMLEAGRDGAFALAARMRSLATAATSSDAAYLLADRNTVGLPRQRADLSGVLRARRRQGRRTDGHARRHACGHFHGRGLHGRAHLHRQRAELHGRGHRRSSAASRCRASSATCCGPARCCCRCWQ